MAEPWPPTPALAAHAAIDVPINAALYMAIARLKRLQLRPDGMKHGQEPFVLLRVLQLLAQMGLPSEVTAWQFSDELQHPLNTWMSGHELAFTLQLGGKNQSFGKLGLLLFFPLLLPCLFDLLLNSLLNHFLQLVRFSPGGRCLHENAIARNAANVIQSDLGFSNLRCSH